MTKEEINKAYENRWRIKSQHLNELDEAKETWYIGGKVIPLIDYIKELCRDFFEAGSLLGDIEPDRLVPPPNKTIFQWWWDMYGKKIDRDKCEKKFDKLTREEKKACIAATPAYVESTPDIQYRRNPLTYLNNKSWENQIIPRNGTDKPTTDPGQKLTDILIG